MGRFVFGLLLGLVGAVTGAGAFQLERQDFPTYPNEGCKLQIHCPADMECVKDANYPNGGRCECAFTWNLIQTKLPFDDSEWDDAGFTPSHSCESLHFANFLASLWYVVNITLLMAFIYTSWFVLRELVGSKALKFNATGTSLVLLFIESVVMCGYMFIWPFNLWGLDKTEYWYNVRMVALGFIVIPLGTIIDFEIAVTWIDLYDRTQKLSKSSSRNVKLLRYTLRFFSFICSVGFCSLTFMRETVGYGATIIASAGGPFVSIPLIGIGSHLIVKTLCPDRKDVANPNWKVAEAIRRGAKHCVGCLIGYLVTVFSLAVISRHPLLGYMYINLMGAFWLFWIIKNWAWLHYLIYGSRKHLKKFNSNSASAYFGFSTIGLNKTLTTASSRMSTTSSAISTKSSVAE